MGIPPSHNQQQPPPTIFCSSSSLPFLPLHRPSSQHLYLAIVLVSTVAGCLSYNHIMQCALSGESLNSSSNVGAVVVTPSGRVCRKDLLLAKLAENGSQDPWHQGRPLQEDDLIEVDMKASLSSSSQVIPPRPLQATSFGALLRSLQAEHDATLLELFDTRQALGATRQELSQALYQADAAVRVIARLSAERDAARQQLQEWQASAGHDAAAPKKRKRGDDGGGDNDALAKSALNEIADNHWQSLHAVWQSLHGNRKALLKKTAAPTVQALQAWAAAPPAWKVPAVTSGIIAVQGQVAGVQDHWVGVTTPEDDKTNIVVSLYEAQKVVSSWTAAAAVKCIDLHQDWVLWGTVDGHVQCSKTNNAATAVGTVTLPATLVHVQVHWDGQHALAATAAGHVLLIDLHAASPTVVSRFVSDDGSAPPALSSATLHPDGLIYVVGTADGRLILWDLKSRAAAGTLQDGATTAAVTRIVVSPNGYHIAAAYADDTVRIWDLRKQALLATLDAAGPALAFDPAAKFFCYGTSQSQQLNVVAAKDWKGKPVVSVKTAGKPLAVAWTGAKNHLGAVISHDAGVQALDQP